MADQHRIYKFLYFILIDAGLLRHVIVDLIPALGWFFSGINSII